MLMFPLVPKTAEALQQQADPSSVPGGQRQVIAHVLYDTNTYPAAGAANLTYFTVARANRFLSNLDTPGALQSGQFFELYAITVDLVAPAQATIQTDLSLVLNGTGVAALGTPTLELEYNSKIYGPWPLRAFHGLGGITGFSTAAAAVEYANNSMPDGGLWMAGPDPRFGGITFGPNQGFGVTLRWPALAAVSQAFDLQVGLAGALHRKVV